jgi:hypothetical protein
MNAKAEALEGIDQARKILESTGMGERLRIGLVLEALAFASERVQHIEELKRKRKEKTA